MSATTTPDIEASLVWAQRTATLLASAKTTHDRATAALRRSVADALGLEKVALNFWWGCPTSPINACVYDDINDRSHDDCVYCHDPAERK